jgi:hypothetical protein
MWCANCLQPVNRFIDHDLCKQQVWLALSREFTQTREAIRKQWNPQFKGETVEVRPRLTRSMSF